MAGHLTLFKTFVIVYSNGTSRWMSPASFISSCPINVKKFPFDRQVCELEFGSWTMDIKNLEFRPINTRNNVEEGLFSNTHFNCCCCNGESFQTSLFTFCFISIRALVSYWAIKWSAANNDKGFCCKQVAEKPRGEHLKMMYDVWCMRKQVKRPQFIEISSEGSLAWAFEGSSA